MNNTQTKKDGEDNQLILYRLDRVEAAVLAVSAKVDALDSLKKSDLNEFRDVVIERVNEVKTTLQQQINNKAEKGQVDDLRTLVKAVGTALTTAIVSICVYYLTRQK